MSDTNFNSELSKAVSDPWLPIETKLVGWSLGIGVALLIVLAIINHFVPVTL